MPNPISTALPADLPTDWQQYQVVSPNGTEAGLSEQHGYNYLMEQVNAAQEGVNALGEAFEDVAPLGEDGKVPAEYLPEMDYDPSGTAAAAVQRHNQNASAHPDIRRELDGKVPNTREINGKALSSDIDLDAGDVGAYTKDEVLSDDTRGLYDISSTTTPDDVLGILAGSILVESRNIELPSSYAWNSVAYGGGKFVAVAGNSNAAAYSTDGFSWTETTLPSSLNWRSVAYGNGRFVAIANNSRSIVYSSDGISWTLEQNALPADSFYSIAYGDGKFVSVRYNSRDAAYSTDGLSWTETDMPSSKYWTSVAYGNGRFVAVSTVSSNTAAYSDDGVSWNTSVIPAGSWVSVAYGNGKFVAIESGGDIDYCTDGTDWAPASTVSGGLWRCITYGDGKFVALDNRTSAAYSSDGIDWETTVRANGDLRAVVYGNGKFAAVPNGIAVFYSTDGITWKGAADILTNVQGSDVTGVIAGALGISALAKIETGSYVGTGTYGEDNPNQLTFSFEPKMWGILCESYRSASNNQAYFTEISIAVAWGVSGTPSDSREIQYSYSGNTVSWYSGENAGYQKNQNNHTYYYFALG